MFWDFSEGGGCFWFWGVFFAFKHFQTTKQRLSIKKGKYFCVTYPEYVIMIKYSDMCFHKQYYNITETYIA